MVARKSKGKERRILSRRLISAAIAILGMLGSTLVTARVAFAAESEAGEIAVVMEDVVEDLGLPIADNPSVVLPDAGEDQITANGLYFLLPVVGDPITIGNTTVFAGAADGTAIGVQETAGGFRALVAIDGPSAPTRYDFELGGSVGRLQQEEGGEVSAFGADGAYLGTFAAPWAIDKDGVSVPTRFEINGKTLTQIVDHAGYQYPVVADPSWWSVAKCVAAIAWVVGSAIFAASKLTKIKSGIKTLGGIKSTAKLLLGATSAAEKASAIGSAFVGVASEFLGIDTIVDNC